MLQGRFRPSRSCPEISVRSHKATAVFTTLGIGTGSSLPCRQEVSPGHSLGNRDAHHGPGVTEARCVMATAFME